MRSLYGALLVVAFLFSQQAYAEEQTLSEVIVTATKTKQEKNEAPASVEVVTGKELKEKNQTYVDQSFRKLPGVFIDRKDGVAGMSDTFASVYLRGMPNASETLVLMNGQPMNNYEGKVQWWSIPMENIDRVEVVKGPFSSLYGGGAMGGVVNIITKADASLVSATYGYGSFNSQLMSAAHGFKVGDFTYSITARTLEMDDPERMSTTWNAGTNNIPITAADGTTSYIQGYTKEKVKTSALSANMTWDMTTESALDLRLTHAEYKLDPDATVNYDGNYLSDSYREHATNTCGVSYRNADLENVEILFNAGLTDNYKDLYIWNNNSQDSVRPNSHYNAGLQSNFTLGRHILSLGTDWNQGRMSTVDEGSTTASTDDKTSKGKLRTLGLFAQDQWSIIQQVTLYTSARYDHWKAYDAATNSSMYGTPIDESSNTDDHVSPKVSLVYCPDKLTAIRASAGEAFRGPSLWEAFRYARGNRFTSIPNPDLKPEIVRSYEVGATRNIFTYFDLGATYFVNRFEDMIYDVYIPDVDGDGRDDKMYDNVGKAKSRGYELTFGFKPVKEVSIYANHTRIITRIEDVDNDDLADDIEGKMFTRIPKYTYNIGANVEYGPVFSNVEARYVGDRYYYDDNRDTLDHTINGYDKYAVMDITLGFRFKYFELTSAVYNVFDREYWEYNGETEGRTYFLTATAKL